MNYCPKHKTTPLLPEGSNILYCPEERCCYATTRANLPKGEKSPRMGDLILCKPNRRAKKEPVEKVIEKDLQFDVVDRLRRLGYEVLEMGKPHGGQRCDACGVVMRHPGWQGNTPDTPDLQVRRSAWPVGMWLDIELKGSQTPISPGQQKLCERGGSYICHTWAQVWAAVETIEAFCLQIEEARLAEVGRATVKRMREEHGI